MRDIGSGCHIYRRSGSGKAAFLLEVIGSVVNVLKLRFGAVSLTNIVVVM